MSRKLAVLFIYDEPSHLKLYAWVLERGGFRPVTALARNKSVELPRGESIAAAVVDYRLGGQISALDVIGRVKRQFPGVPVIILSDMFWMPDDVAPFAAACVRKGEPESLLNTIAAVIGGESLRSLA